MRQYAFIVFYLKKFWNTLDSQKRLGKLGHAFVRRGTVGPKNGKLLFFHMTYAPKDIRGAVDLIEWKVKDAEELWNSLGHESLLNSCDEYLDFLQKRKKTKFVSFRNLRELLNLIPAKTISPAKEIN